MSHSENADLWLRFFDRAGQLVSTGGEAEAERAQVEAEARRAAEAELERLWALLKQQDNQGE